MADIKYVPGEGLATKREYAKKYTDEKLISEFKNVCLHAVAHGDFMRHSFPFYLHADKLYLMLWGEWYQAIKEEVHQRMSDALKDGELHLILFEQWNQITQQEAVLRANGANISVTI